MKNTWVSGEALPFETFLHGVQLVPDNFLAVWNISLAKFILSPDFAARHDEGLRQSHESFRDLPLENLLRGEIPTGVLAPRVSKYSFVGLVDRMGLRAGLGLENTKYLKPEKQEERRRIADLEIDFERYRREVNPTAACRLGCIWLAENSTNGKSGIASIFHGNHHALTAIVSPFDCVTRADAQWIGLYYEKNEPRYAKSYWSGEPASSDPSWEYLVEGRVAFEESQVQELCAKALLFGAWPAGVALPPLVQEARDKGLAKG